MELDWPNYPKEDRKKVLSGVCQVNCVNSDST